ncbi:MAG: type IV pilus twitching motility protein PilT [Deltaproteobacteria bacterium]|nr:MAG: type IV pilus twitching motility protein PilT [Deltaproteobacteria bacterium]TMA92619.1 MAG: type IV pilus twitching motility protein PilT [Deltaproteobacteria bacterium]TMB24502.1 MAG: type IV pilus twitching motility protein PilT [Deltaproteobacteria bacterium]
MELDAILREGVGRKASDIHLKTGAPPVFRVSGTLTPWDEVAPIDRDAMAALARALLKDYHGQRLERELQVDVGYGHPELGRFRVNVFYQRGEIQAALRLIPARVRQIRELNLPPVIERIASERRGLVLVTGTTGSGKSTTLAAIIDYINRTVDRHIITIEDPIEYLHRDERSIVTQREIGADCLTFAAGLKGALRQDPDVILVGEMRDLETIETAILAAETGHLVMSTLHTLDAAETITRVIQAFPDHQRAQARLILASILKGCISQRLVPRADGAGMVPAVEVMVSTGLVKECVQVPERTREIRDAIARGYVGYGMQTFDQSLMALWREGLITFDEALAQSTNPDDFALKARGISSTSDSRWDDFDREDGNAAEEPIKVDRF